jgi:hypothetical protein
MEIRDSSLYDDIIKIASVPPVHPEFMWTVTLFTPEGELIIDDAKSLTIKRDYVSTFSDESMINFDIGIGTFVNVIYPFKHNLSIEVMRRPIIRGTDSTLDASEYATKEIYRGILVDQTSFALLASSEMTSDTAKGDRSKRISVSMQLVEPLLDKHRTKLISGIFKGTWTDILKAVCRAKLLLEPWEKDVDLELVRARQQHELAGVDVREPDNKIDRKQLLVPKGTRLINFPDYCQRRYGLYNHSLGSYIERGEWYIWGLHNTDLYSSSDRTLTIALLDTNAAPATDNSYSMEEKHVKLLATGEIKHLDNTEMYLQNLGNGVRYQDANKLLDGYADTTAGVTTISRARNLREYLVETRDDGLNWTPYASRLTSNHHKELSELNERRGAIVNVQWQNSDPDVLRPGMPAKILYSGKDGIKSLEGIMIGSQHAYSKDTQNFTDTRVRCNSALTLWVKRDV